MLDCFYLFKVFGVNCWLKVGNVSNVTPMVLGFSMQMVSFPPITHNYVLSSSLMVVRSFPVVRVLQSSASFDMRR